MKSKLRMTFEEFYESGMSNGPLTGYLDLDISNLFECMVFFLLPEKLPNGYLYSTGNRDLHETSKTMLDSINLNYVHSNLECCVCYLWLRSGEIMKFHLMDDETEDKIINNYFVQPLAEIIDQMKQYYRDNGIELKKDIKLHLRGTLSGRKVKII